jgi:hypothetical protein
MNKKVATKKGEQFKFNPIPTEDPQKDPQEIPKQSKRPRVKSTISKEKGIKVAKEVLGEIVDIGVNIKKGLFASQEKQSLNELEKTELLKAYKETLSKTYETKQGRIISEYVSQLRDPNLSKGKLPEIIESHIDISYIEEEVTISGGPFRLARGNWIQIDLGCKDKNDTLRLALEELDEPTNPRLSKVSILPTTFLKRFNAIIEILRGLEKKKTSTTDKKYENQANLISWLCMAYLEILEEESLEPSDDISKPTGRPYKSQNTGIPFFKTCLLKQSTEEVAPEGTPIVDSKAIKHKVASSISTNISTKEAVELSCILAEREIEPFKHSYKRETLFKMRAYLTSKFFEEAKTHRHDGDSIDDHILTQKPRYKTPCVWLVVHRNNQRSEILAVKPTSNVSYWGNPDSEKEKYSIIPINQPQRIWDSINTKAIKKQLIKHQTPITLGVVLFSLLSVSLGLFAEMPSGSDSKQRVTNLTTQRGPFEEEGLKPSTNVLEKSLEISEISPNNVGGTYDMNVNTPVKNKVTSKSNSMEW